jgi:quinol monooxygenase YgiN
MTCKVVLEIRAKPEHVDDVLEFLCEQLPATRAYKGCLEVFAYQEQDDPTAFIAIQEWESRGHYEEYFVWRGERGDLDTLDPFIAQLLAPRFFDKIA